MAGVGIFATIYLTPLYLGERDAFRRRRSAWRYFFHRSNQVMMSIPFLFEGSTTASICTRLLMAGLIGFAGQCTALFRLSLTTGADQLLLPAGLSRTS